MANKGDHHDAVVAQVLQITVQHVERLTAQDVARLLQLSSACRRALQQAVGCCGIPRMEYDKLSLAATTGLAAWLPHRAGLLQRVALFRHGRWGRPSKSTPEDDASWAAAEQLMVFALQMSSTPTAVPAATIAASQLPSQPAPLLRLQSFTSDYIHNPVALSSLVACSTLTALELLRIPQQRFTAALCDAIGQLRALRRLELGSASDARPSVCPSALTAALARLTQLEVFETRCLLPPAGLPLLPPSLTEVTLGVDCTGGSKADINISQLSQLQVMALTLNKRGCISAQSQLPDSLTSMGLVCGAGAVPGLGQLQWLHLPSPAMCLELLGRLPQLPALQHLKVGLQHCRQAQLEPVLAALSTGTQLQIYFSDHMQEFDRVGADMEDVFLHSYLKKLPQLQALHVTGLKLYDADLVHFTALTALTDLTIADCKGKHDQGIAAIMQRLTGLRVLKLQNIELSNCLIWVSAACLTNLVDLHCTMCDPIAVTDDTLHLLAPLTSLTHLSLDAIVDPDDDTVYSNVSDDAVESLLQQLPLLGDYISWVDGA